MVLVHTGRHGDAFAVQWRSLGGRVRSLRVHGRARTGGHSMTSTSVLGSLVADDHV
jgi:hypothetical protein